MKLLNVSILLVDDEVDLREIISEEFTSAGALVTCAENGRKAFEVLQKNKFDIVFSDVRMTGGDGIELIQNHPLCGESSCLCARHARTRHKYRLIRNATLQARIACKSQLTIDRINIGVVRRCHRLACNESCPL